MKRVALALLLAPMLILGAEATGKPRIWVPVQYNLWDLYSNGGMEQDILKRETRLVSSTTASWPDGRQALINYVEVKQEKKTFLYRCVDYTDASFQSTGQICYELRDPRK